MKNTNAYLINNVALSQLVNTTFWVSLLSLLLLSSCKSKQVISNQNVPKKSTRFLLKKMNQQEVNVDWFSSKAKIKYSDQYDRIGATANIRMQKDKVIWMNVKKAGVEAFRIKITQDSVYMISRLEKEYMIEGLDFVEKRFGLPADFNAIQRILLGNALFISDKKPDSKIKDNQYYLNSEKDNIRSEYWLEGQTFNLAKMAFLDVRNDREVSMTLENYDELDDKQKFSYFRELNMNAEETGKVETTIKFSNVEINTPKSIKFDIPKRYKRFVFK